MSKKKLGNCPVKDLTQREFDVLHLLSGGRSYREIGEKLDLSENTVKYHVHTMISKTGYPNSISLIAHAVKYKLVDPDQEWDGRRE